MGYILLSICFPIIVGVFLLLKMAISKEIRSRRTVLAGVSLTFAITAIFVFLAMLHAGSQVYTVCSLTERLPIVFQMDEISILFVMVVLIIFFCAGIFSFVYMKHEEKEQRYFGFYLIVMGILIALCFAGNLITFYLFFELLTISSVPLVLHNRSRQALMAGLKYLFYSLCGAYMALFGIYFIDKYANTLTFHGGGVLDVQAITEQGGLLLGVAMVMLIGFGVKAGMFPMHAWLPAAHPVAPAPASAVLSAVIVKAGVLAVIRVVYFIFGVDFLRGTWVQTVWLTLTLITIFMGSMLAYRESELKKRLAYSTISQVAYILFGLAVMNGEAVTGGLLQVLCHGFVKAALFLCAGAIIYQTGKTQVDQLRGMGKEMPILMWCYTIAALGLIGIPPTGGFISKWFLVQGSLSSQIPVFQWLGPVVLLISALLTAGYLLPITISGFFPGADFDDSTLQKKEPGPIMLIPIMVLTALSVVIGLCPNWLTDSISRFLEKLM